MAPALTSALLGLTIGVILAPFGYWAVRWAKRHRGGGVAVSGLLLLLGMNMTVTPPPPVVAEQLVRRENDDDEPKDGEP